MKIPLFGAWSEEEHREADYKSLRNLYIHPTPGGRSSAALYHMPGSKVWATVGVGPIRAMRRVGDLLYVVSGSELYSITTIGAATLRGTLSTTVGNVGISDNGNALIMVDGTAGYTYTFATTTFTTISDADFPNGATQVDFMDSYFIVNDPANNGRFYISASYDGTSWAALDFATAERSPDSLQGLIVNSRELWLIGDTTAETWWNAGGADFPFQPVQSAFSQWGCAAPDSIAKIDHSVYWLSRQENGEGVVMKTQGLTPTVVSSPAITKKISTLTNIENATGFCFQWDIHTFYVLTFPSDELTLVFDNATQEWFEWSNFTAGRHRANNHALFENMHLVGDFENSNIYQLDHNTHDDNGTVIERLFRTPQIHADDKILFHSALELLMNVGSGTATETDPQIMMRYSDDKGNTWSNEYWRDIGAQGNYDKRVVWRKLGSSFSRIYEIKITDAVEVAIIDGFIRATAGERET